MAILWAMEDSNLSAGWDEEKELDYTAIVRKPSGNPDPRQQESKSSVDSDACAALSMIPTPSPHYSQQRTCSNIPSQLPLP